METETTEAPATVEQPARPSPIVDWMAAALGHETERQKSNPYRPAGVVFEFHRFAALTPVDAARALADFDRALAAVKPLPSDLQIANLRMKLARGARGSAADTLVEMDYPASDAEQLGMPAGTFAIRHGAVPVAHAVKLLLDEKRSPEAEIERRQLAFRQQHVAREQEAARLAQIEREAQEKQTLLRRRAQAWLSRPHVERTLLRLAHARPQDAELLRAIAAALITDADNEDQIPPGDIDLLPKVRPF